MTFWPQAGGRGHMQVIPPSVFPPLLNTRPSDALTAVQVVPQGAVVRTSMGGGPARGLLRHRR
jgi:hypothetical protein